MKKELRNERGITLIALVITVIVLLILAGVTIGLLTGENGILNTAKNAADKYNNAALDEQNQIDNLLNLIEGEGETIPVGFVPLYTRADLEKIGSGVQGYVIDSKSYNMDDNAKYILMNDIDLENVNWIPLPNFSGELNGNGKTIYNLKINSNDMSTGFFNTINTSTNDVLISKLRISGVNIVNHDFDAQVGVLTGVIEGSGNCYMSEIEMINGTVDGNHRIGSLAGAIWSKTEAKNIYTNITVKSVQRIGGISAEITTDIKFENCLILGEVISSSSIKGAIAGYYDSVNVISDEFKNIYWYNSDKYTLKAFGSFTTQSYNLPPFNSELETKQKASYVGFDFVNTWKIDEGNSSPTLKIFK